MTNEINLEDEDNLKYENDLKWVPSPNTNSGTPIIQVLFQFSKIN